MTLNRLLIAIPMLGLAACQQPTDSDGTTPTANDAKADETIPNGTLIDAAGKVIGSVEMSEEPSGLILRINASGLAGGMHGLHLHEKGLCEGVDFKSAGAHWNPAGRQHGRDNPNGSHLGDLANLQVGDDGTGTTAMMVGGASVAGAMAIADADGTALVIHAKADDYKTDPSGDSGDRIACAVLAPPKAN